MKYYRIIRPYQAIDPRYNDHEVLCEHLQDPSIKDFKKCFETFHWSEINPSSINECLKVIGDYFNLDHVHKLFVMHEAEGYDIYTYDNSRTTVDGSEEYFNGLTWLCHIHANDSHEEA
jgi:hypothetical protein